MLFMDGFDYYSTTEDAYLYIWDSDSAVQSIGALGSGVYGYGKYLNPLGASNIKKTFGANLGTVYLGFHLYNTAADDRSWLDFYDLTTQQFAVSINATGYIKVWRGNKTTLLGTSSIPIIFNTWNWIAIKIVFSQTVGTVDIQLNDVSVLSLSSQDTCATANEYATKISIDVPGGVGYLDNFHLYDGSDPAPFNAILSERRIYFDFPTGDSASETGWTASAGAKYACLDENPPTVTDYISSLTPGDKYGGTFAELPSIAPGVIKLSVWCVKDDATARLFRLYNKQSASFYTGDSEVLIPTVTMKSKQWLANPAGGAWDKTAVDASEWGVELVS